MADESNATNQEELIETLCGVTGVNAKQAREYLEANEWNLAASAAAHYNAEEAVTSETANAPPEEPPYTGPRTLDGRPAPQAIPSVGSGSSSSRGRGKAADPRGAARKTGVAGIATLGSISNQDPHAGHGHAHDDDDDDYSDEDIAMTDDEPRDMFAGGEKSGLAVQDPSKKDKNDPKKVVDDILKKARANVKKAGGGEASAAPPSRFHGTGNTLGSDDTPSQSIPDPQARSSASTQTQTRILHLWQDGFSVEDGPLRRFDDAQNAQDLSMIRSGRAPLHLMGVRADQSVDVQLVKHEEKYRAPPKVYKPFGGSGQRLGSPTPGPSGTSTAVSEPAATPATTTQSTPTPEIDSTAPTLSLRIQLADGRRMPARFNTTQTIGDVYDFINRADPNPTERAWVLATTFPNKDHTDKSQVLGEMAEFKRGGTAVQKWA